MKPIHSSSFSASTARASLLCCVILATSNLAFAAQPTIEPAPKPRQFRAGAATSNITPKLGGGIVGGWNTPPATHIHDELHARCLVLDDGQTRLVFAICDSVGINREVFDEAKRLLHDATGIPVQNMLMSATHTHSATSARGERPIVRPGDLDDYQGFLASRIVDGVRCALNNLEPARIGWGSAQEPRHVFNRRWFMKPGTPLPNPFGGEDKVLMNPGVAGPNLLEPAGTTDPEICFLSIQSANGRPIALLANYSLHYVGGVPEGHISADYFALFADRIQQLLGADRQDPPFVGLMSNGTSGNVNNINFRGPAERLPPYAKMRRVANDVADAVLKANANIQFHDWVPLSARARELSLRTRKPSPELLARAREILARPANVPPKHRHEVTYARRTLEMSTLPDQRDYPMQAFRIGDLGITAIPFEVFAESGLEIKARSPFKPAFTIEQANGTYGYLPTPEQHKLGGYETWLGSNRVEEDASTKIVATVLELLSEMK